MIMKETIEDLMNRMNESGSRGGQIVIMKPKDPPIWNTQITAIGIVQTQT